MTPGLIYFALCALVTLLGGVATVAAKNPIRSAMGLLATIVGIAGFYLQLSAEFMAAIQILVYAGAVVVLFLFVMMLLGVGAMSPRDARTATPRYIGAGMIAIIALAAGGLMFKSGVGKTIMDDPRAALGTVESMSEALFSDAVVAFEFTGVLLLVAIVGAVAVARGKSGASTGEPT